MQFSTDQPDLASIPTPYYAPPSTPLSTSDIQNSTLVVFDLEISNIGRSTCSSPWHSKLHVFLSCVFLLFAKKPKHDMKYVHRLKVQYIPVGSKCDILC